MQLADTSSSSSNIPSTSEQHSGQSRWQVETSTRPEVDGDRTPRASHEHVDDSEENTASQGSSFLTITTALPNYTHTTKDAVAVRPTLDTHTSYTSDAASTLVPQSNYAPSTLNSYAPSSIVENRSLLPHMRRHYGSMPQHEQQRLQKTKGRKAFEGVCYVVDYLVPIDVSEDVTSMRDSSIGKAVQAVHDWGEKRRAGHESHESHEHHHGPEMSEAR